MDPEIIRQHLEDNLEDEEEKERRAIEAVINKVKSQGLFDQFRKECLADVDTKPAYHNLTGRVEKFVEHFLRSQKWNSIKNKNQLRETLRRQLNGSGMMNNGIERIIEQVVNPKILLGIKPKIDEAVCQHLGIDLKARQEEMQRRKHEQQRLFIQHHMQQQHLQNMMNQNRNNNEEMSQDGGLLPPALGLLWSPPAGMGAISNTSTPGNPQGPRPHVSSHPMGPFGGMMQPFPLMGSWPQGLPGMQAMIPGHPMIPAPLSSMSAATPGATAGIDSFSATATPSPASAKNVFSTPPVPTQTSTPVVPDFSKPPPGVSVQSSMPNLVGTTAALPGMAIQSSPLMPPGVMTASVGAIRPPPPGSVPPPPGTSPIPTPGVRHGLPTTPTLPALLTHTLSKVSEEELTPEKIAVFKTAAAFITKTVNRSQGTPGADLASMFSPRVLAEAMMEESGTPLTKHEMRAAKRRERIKEIERIKTEREEKDREEMKNEELKKPEEKDEDPLPPKSNLMDVFQAAEDVSDDEEAFDMLADIEEGEDKYKQGVVLSDDEEEDQAPTNQPGKSQSVCDIGNPL